MKSVGCSVAGKKVWKQNSRLKDERNFTRGLGREPGCQRSSCHSRWASSRWRSSYGCRSSSWHSRRRLCALSHPFHHPLNTLRVVSYAGHRSPQAQDTNALYFLKTKWHSSWRKSPQPLWRISFPVSWPFSRSRKKFPTYRFYFSKVNLYGLPPVVFVG